MSNGSDAGPARREASASSFTEFYESNIDRLYGGLIVVTRNPYVAEEMCQEAFARIWSKWARVSKMKNPQGYLFRTALNAYFDKQRHDLQRPAALTNLASPDALDAVEGKTVVEKALLSLPERQRAALVITEMLGYDSVTAAKILRVRPSTVRTLSSLARKQIVGLLDSPEEEA